MPIGKTMLWRATIKQENFWLKVLIGGLFIVILWQNLSWRKHADKLVENLMVIEVSEGEASVVPGKKFVKGPTKEEVLARASDFVTCIMGAGSGDVDILYARAIGMMTESLKTNFEIVLKDGVKDIKGRNIYKSIEVAPREMNEKDLPEGSNYEFNRFDIVVTGTVVTYQANTSNEQKRESFSFLVKLVPLSKRTLEQPTGLLVSSIKAINAKQKANGEVTVDKQVN